MRDRRTLLLFSPAPFVFLGLTVFFFLSARLSEARSRGAQAEEAPPHERVRLADVGIQRLHIKTKPGQEGGSATCSVTLVNHGPDDVRGARLEVRLETRMIQEIQDLSIPRGRAKTLEVAVPFTPCGDCGLFARVLPESLDRFEDPNMDNHHAEALMSLWPQERETVTAEGGARDRLAGQRWTSKDRVRVATSDGKSCSFFPTEIKSVDTTKTGAPSPLEARDQHMVPGRVLAEEMPPVRIRCA